MMMKQASHFVVLEQYSVVQSSTGVVLSSTEQYFVVRSSTGVVLCTGLVLCSTKYYWSSTLQYGIVLDQYFVVQRSTGVVLEQYWSTTLQYREVLEQYFVVQNSTGVVLCSTEQYWSSTGVVLCSTGQYWSSTLEQYWGSTLQFFVVQSSTGVVPQITSQLATSLESKSNHKHITPKRMTSQPCNGKSFVQTHPKKLGHRNGRSSCAQSIGKFFLCYIVFFF